MGVKRIVGWLVVCWMVSSATVFAQPTPSGPTVQHVICDSGCGPGGSSNVVITAITYDPSTFIGHTIIDSITGTVTVQGTIAATQSGTWNIGTLTTLTSITNPVAVTGTFWQATQPISAVALPLPSGAATEATLSTLNGKVTAVNTGAVVVSSSALPTGAATETTLSTLNGKVTAVNTGAVVVASSALPSGAATAALQTQPGVDIGDVTVNNASGGSAVNIQDGGNTITVDGSVTVSDGSGALNTIVDSGTLTTVTTVGTITNPVTVTDGAGSLNVIVDSGTLTAVTSITNAVAVTDNSGSLTVDQPTGTNLHTVVDSGSVTVSDGAGALNVIVDSGTLTAVTAITNALPAGSNIIGNVRIDQTTPGTTNRVDVGVFPDNEPINVAQFGGTNVSTGVGNGGSGIPRVTVSSDSIIASVTGAVAISNAFALEATQLTGNVSLASIKTNTDPLVTAGGGGYVRQDSTFTIARETGGNLATVAALSKAEDALHVTGDPGVQLLGVRNDVAAALTTADGDYSPLAVDSHGHAFTRIMGQQNGTENNAIVSQIGALMVSPVVSPGLPLRPCNPVRRTNCQPKGF